MTAKLSQTMEEVTEGYGLVCYQRPFTQGWREQVVLEMDLWGGGGAWGTGA